MPLSDDDLREMSGDELLVLAMEEAAETMHAAVKAFRHGLLEHNPLDDTHISNVLTLCQEGEQISATVRIMGAKYGLNWGYLSHERHEAAKLQRAALDEREAEDAPNS